MAERSWESRRSWNRFKVARIGLLVEKRGNRNLLASFLKELGHQISVPQRTADYQFWDDLQLLLIDESCARRSELQLRQLKARPNLVPVLLLLSSVSPGGSGWLQRGLIDDVIRKPIAKVDLVARIRLALNLSRQSQVANLKLERLVKDASWGVVVFEPESQQIQVSNDAFANLHGYARRELIGMPISNLQLHPTWLTAGEFECIHVRRDGTTFPIELELTHYPETGGAGYLGAFARDIEARKKTEAELLRQHQELEAARLLAERADRAKSDFLANASHEIRTPLNGMLATLEMLLKTPLDESQRELAHLARHSSETLLDLVSEVLDFSKIEAGKMHLEEVSFNLSEILIRIVRPFTLQAQKQGLEMKLDLDSKLPKFIVGDPLRLSQILQNLLSNALKFTPTGSVSVRARSSKDTLCVEVEDQGIGIDAEDQATIFQPFTQADTSTTRRYGGTGLGLAICARLVSLMGGTLVLDSQPGVGSRFQCRLPLIASESAQAKVAEVSGAPEPKSGPPLDVLICEDNPLNQRIMMLLLEQLGHRGTLAEDGETGITAWQNGEFDLILMDLQMPKVGGMEATRQIRQRGGTLPIIALTARTVEGDREACLAAGMDDYLTKPVRVDVLRDLLVRLSRDKESARP